MDSVANSNVILLDSVANSNVMIYFPLLKCNHFSNHAVTFGPSLCCYEWPPNPLMASCEIRWEAKICQFLNSETADAHP